MCQRAVRSAAPADIVDNLGWIIMPESEEVCGSCRQLLICFFLCDMLSQGVVGCGSRDPQD